MDPVGILRQTSVFRDLPPAALAPLLPDVRERSFARGESLWVEGDPARSLFVLAEGQVKSHRVSRDGAEVILVLHSGVDVIGEVGLFHPSGVRQVSVTAMTPVRCLLVGREPLLRFLERNPPAMRRMFEQLSTIAVRAAYSFSGVAFDDIRRRVAAALLALAEEYGEPAADGAVRIGLRLSQGTLAAFVAASRENVNRALSTLVASGALSQRDGHFYVHDRAVLERVAREDP